jgi:hypothetical protein
MKVETYEVEEIQGDAGNMAADSEAIELCTQLGLVGQLALSNTETATRAPYRKMTAREQLVFGLICPIKTEVSQYKSGIIPLRVLQVVAYCKENNLYKRIDVWHPEDAKLDPVLVGATAHPDYDWMDQDLFLLARWGEVWKDFSQLIDEAKKVWMSKAKADLSRIRSEVESDLKTLDTIADAVFTSGKQVSPRYNFLKSE